MCSYVCHVFHALQYLVSVKLPASMRNDICFCRLSCVKLSLWQWGKIIVCRCRMLRRIFGTGRKVKRSRSSVVGIATGYGLDDWGVEVRVPVGSRIFSSPNRPDRLWGPPKLLPNGYRGLFPRGVKRHGHEAEHSPPACAEVKKM
jgi:hypothetical protein